MTRPSRALLLAEARTIVEFVSFLLSGPLQARMARGDGHPVMALPGFLASDLSTIPLRRFLRAQGWDAHGWGGGRNLGRPGQEDDVVRFLDRLWRREGRKVSLIGWSLGGVYAREIARLVPDRVRQVISMGSPFAGDPRANHAWWIYERLSGRTYEDLGPRVRARLRQRLPVPSTAIYSRSDGVTAWECCVERPGRQAESIEVPSSHLGYGHNPLVLEVIADRLAQPEERWRPFVREGRWRRLFYPEPEPTSATPVAGP